MLYETTDALSCAVALELPEIADAMMRNPHYPSALFGELPWSTFDEDLLALSILRPGELTTRFVARGLATAERDVRVDLEFAHMP